MTTGEEAEAQAQETLPPEAAHQYWVDPARFDELSRSMEVLLLTRRCRSCLAQEVNSAQPPSADEQIKHIVGCCAQDDSFIRPGMPLQEIVFRLILAGGNAPVNLTSLHYRLTEEWSTPGNPMNISAGGLKRVLDSDDFYGFRELAPAEEEAQAA